LLRRKKIKQGRWNPARWGGGAPHWWGAKPMGEGFLAFFPFLRGGVAVGFPPPNFF